MLNEGREIKDYTLKRFLGRGGFGEVRLAEKKIEIADKKVLFALKFLSGDNQRISDYSSVRREINTWIDASGNKNVVSVLDGFTPSNFSCIETLQYSSKDFTCGSTPSFTLTRNCNGSISLKNKDASAEERITFLHQH